MALHRASGTRSPARAMAAFSPLRVLTISANAIDHDVARDLPDGDRRQHEQPSGFALPLTCRRLPISTLCVAPFPLANAPMLPLVGQQLALGNKNLGTANVALHSGGAACLPMRKAGRRGPQAVVAF